MKATSHIGLRHAPLSPSQTGSLGGCVESVKAQLWNIVRENEVIHHRMIPHASGLAMIFIQCSIASLSVTYSFSYRSL